ncbi:MAG: cell division protein ZapA [Nitrospinaceae bacterium]|nr:cell division protein ZapA [Nitrospinaceae bacterium]
MGEPVSIRVLGANFTIQTDQDSDYVATLVEYIREKADALQRVAGSQDTLKTAILVSLLIADELHQLKRGEAEASKGGDNAEAIARKMIERIDAVLDNDRPE